MRWKKALAGLAFGLCLLWQGEKIAGVRAMPAEQGTVGTLLFYVNAARAAQGLPPYALNPLLTQAAQAHSDYQRDLGYWTHEGPGGSRALDRVLAVGYPAVRVNENIYASSLATPQSVVEWWLTADEAHRDNVLHPALREVGFGVSTDVNGVVYYTMNISAQPNVLPVFINSDSPSASSPSVTLTLTNEAIFSSEPGHIGWADQVMISNTPDFAGATQQPWAQTISWALDAATPGIKTVYVRFIDGAGRTAASQDSIVLENATPLPTVAPRPPAQATVTPTLPPPPPTYTPASPLPSLTAAPTSALLALSPSPVTITNAPPPTLITAIPPAAPTPITGQAPIVPAQMLFFVLLGLGISALLIGGVLLARSSR